MPGVVARLAAEGLHMPAVAAPIGAYVPAVRTGSLVFTSGQLPLEDGALIASGLVGRDVSLESAQQCARRCALNALAAAASVCDIEQVTRVVKVTGFVACDADFGGQPAVINGASDLLATAFGDAGKHAREAVGVASLPMNAPVEVSVVLEIG